MRWAAFLFAVLVPQTAYAVGAPTVYDNYQNFHVGSRAAGMAGAYTALGCDEGALHYNAAALACAVNSRLELTANVYQLQSVSVPDAFGEGQDVSATTYHSLPAVAGMTKILLDGDADRIGRLVFGLSVEVPHSVAVSAEPAQPTKPNYIEFKVRDQILSGDIGLGYQINRRWAVGLTAGVMMRTTETRLSTLFTDTDPIPCSDQLTECHNFYQSGAEQENLAVGGRFKAAVRWTPTRKLSVGLVVTSPTFSVYGNSKIVSLTSYGVSYPDGGQLEQAFGAVPLRLNGSSDVDFPLRVAMGVAYTTDRFTLSIDGSLNFPRNRDVAYDLIAEPIESVPTLEDPQDQELFRTWQPNLNIGAEFKITDGVAVAAGAFTDMSSVSLRAVTEANEDAVDMFGVSLALGMLGEQVSGWFGASFEYGSTTSKVYSGSLDFSQLVDFEQDGLSRIERWNLAGFIGSSYSFPQGTF